MLSHICPRKDCVYNSSLGCTFYVGDLYFSICLDKGTMYTPKDVIEKEKSVKDSSIDICYL